MEMLQKRGLSQENLLGTMRSKNAYRTFTYAIEKAMLTASLIGSEQYTLFAPTDEAFRQLPHGMLDRLLRPENRDELAAIVTYHMVIGSRTTADIRKWDAALTLHGQAASITISSGQLHINGAQITRPDIMAGNGVIHGIDRVNIPETETR